MKRKGRRHLRKIRGTPGELEDGGLGPLTPPGIIDAWGKIARASVSSDPHRRRAGLIFLIVAAVPALFLIAGLIVVAFRDGL